jgi:K(+)-stimulated pyrophosphate-energized sodium pump
VKEAVKEVAKDAGAATAAAATAAADAAKAAAAGAATAAASGAAAVLTYLDKAPDALTGAPVAKVYFDTGKTDLPADTEAVLKPVIDFVKANAGTKGVISGFHDPTGDKAQNEELAKNRAKMVRERLRAAGFGEDQIMMIKPFQTAGSGDNKEARRVEVSVIKGQ